MTQVVPVQVVIGPRTRLGAELLGRDRGAAQVFGVARDDRDAAALNDSGVSVLRAGSGEALPDGVVPSSLRIDICALGPVHPGDPRTAVDAANAARDLAVVKSLLDAAPAGAATHVVLVSSVIALAPGADRRYYGGWKGLVEEELQALVDSHPGARLSVLYPGRLVAEGDVRRPWHRMHTRYRRLADAVETAGRGSGSHRVVGLDARLWLLVRGLSVVLTAFTGAAGSSKSRPAAPHTLSAPSQESPR